MKLNNICSTWSNDRAFSIFQEWLAFTVKEVEGTLTAEEALRYTYKLIFKQDLKEIREWGLFTEREGLMQMGRYHFQILWTLPFQFFQDIFDKTTRSQVKTLRGYLSWIKILIPPFIHFDVLLKKCIKKIFLETPSPLISGSGWSGSPLSEGLDPPLYGALLLNRCLSQAA